MLANVERQAVALASAQRHWRERGGPTAITIALTREAGTPGTSVAEEVGRRLGWTVYDHTLVERIASEMGLRDTLLESVDEKRKSWLLDVVEAFAAEKSVNQAAFVRQLVETVLSLGAHGQCVIVGRGAAHILPPTGTLRVRLVAPREDRIAATERRLNVNKDQATKWVDDTDRARSAFVKDHFIKDTTDPHLYDLILNTARWSVAECADLIVQAVKELTVRAGT